MGRSTNIEKVKVDNLQLEEGAYVDEKKREAAKPLYLRRYE